MKYLHFLEEKVAQANFKPLYDIGVKKCRIKTDHDIESSTVRVDLYADKYASRTAIVAEVLHGLSYWYDENENLIQEKVPRQQVKNLVDLAVDKLILDTAENIRRQKVKK